MVTNLTNDPAPTRIECGKYKGRRNITRVALPVLFDNALGIRGLKVGGESSRVSELGKHNTPLARTAIFAQSN